MGNLLCCVELKLDQPNRVFEAGGVVAGHVNFTAPESELRNIRGIYLVLKGQEHVRIPDVNDPSRHHYHYERRVHDCGTFYDRSTHTILRADYPVVKFQGDELCAGYEYEYPFHFVFPSDLPSSMQCQQDRSIAEIRYTLSVHVDVSIPAHSAAEKLARDSVVLHVRARPSKAQPAPISIPAREFAVKTLGLWNRGSIQMGWKADKDVYSPKEPVSVSVSGQNNSKVKVKYLSVKIVECVDFHTSQDHLHTTVNRTLAEQTIPVESFTWWNTCQTGHDVDEGLATVLHLPSDARESYVGDLIHVRHYIVVAAKTGGAFITTSPESTSQINIVHFDKSSESLPSPASSSPAMPISRWQQSTKVIKATALAHTNATLVSPPVSMEEHQVFCSTPTITRLPPDHAFSSRTGPPTVKELQNLLRSSSNNNNNNNNNPNDMLHSILDSDEAWVELVQNLTPRDYSATVQCAATGKDQAPKVAQELAKTMGSRMSTRHLLACMYSLPDDDDLRMKVLEMVAPLASDVDGHWELIEQELTPEELVRFQAAMQKVDA